MADITTVTPRIDRKFTDANGILTQSAYALLDGLIRRTGGVSAPAINATEILSAVNTALSAATAASTAAAAATAAANAASVAASAAAAAVTALQDELAVLPTTQDWGPRIRELEDRQ